MTFQMKNSGRILVIDDDPTLLTLLDTRLKDQGCDIRTAPDGMEGLSVCQHFQPDLIILDIMMPKMDGFTFVQEFKHRGGNLRTTPIVILTSRDRMQDIFKIEGINDYIIKPFDMEYLQRKIDKRLGSKEKRILVVDDEAENLDLLENCLETSSYDVLRARDGLEGLNIAHQERPDLMILDIMLPKLNGYNICRMLKYDRNFQSMPIILFSALTRETDRMTARQVGADAYLTKPYDGTVLLDTIKGFFWD